MRCLGRETLVVSNYDQLCRVPNRGQGAGATRPESTLGRRRVAPAPAGHGRCYAAESRPSASLAQMRIEVIWLRMRPRISNLKPWKVKIWPTSGMQRPEERREGKSVSVRVVLGGRRIIKKKPRRNMKANSNVAVPPRKKEQRHQQ